MIKHKVIILILTAIFLLNLSSGALDFSNPFFPKLTKDTTKTSSVIFSQITGIDNNGCTGTNKVTNVSFINGDLQIICATDEIGAGGSGDITSVIAGTGLFGGGTSSDVTLNVSASTCSAGEVSKYNGTGFVCVTDSIGNGTINLTYIAFLNNSNQFFEGYQSFYELNVSYLYPSNFLYFNNNNFWDINDQFRTDLIAHFDNEIIFGIESLASCNADDKKLGTDNDGKLICDIFSGGNVSWNESLADTLYASIIWGYNMTTPFTNWLSTFVYNYNQTIPANSYTDSQVNKTFNQTLTDTLYAPIGSTNNASWNQSLADTLYSSIIWNYNQTTATFNLYGQWWYNQTLGAITDINSRFWNKTQSYNKTEIDSFNASWTSTYNATYDSNMANNSWNQSFANTLYYSISNPSSYYNVTTLPPSSASIGYYINYTPITTTGNITNGSLKGYLAANAICNTYYSGSHMCQTGEILNSINRNQSNINFTATFWISEGAPGYLSESYDCSGLTTSASASLGSIWVGNITHTNTFGNGGLVTCSASRAIGCCI